jgi:hypothetical protein
MSSQLVDEVANQKTKQAISFSPDTERLLVKFLKMQMAKFYFGIFFKLFILGIVIFSIVFSVKTVVPFIQDNIGMMSDLQKTIESLSSGKFSGLENFKVQGVTDEKVDEIEEATKDSDLKDEIEKALKKRIDEVEE